MQVKEVKSEGLKREYEVKVGADVIEAQMQKRLQEVGAKTKIPGFRPGKVPMNVLKQKYGKSVMGEVLEKTIDETTKKVVNDNKLQPALQPKVEITAFDEGKDLAFRMAVEIYPDMPEVKPEALTIEKPVYDVPKKEIDEGIDRLAARYAETKPLTSRKKAKQGDIVVIDYKGTVDGEAFEGGTGTDMKVKLGSGSLVPGFEDQLEGIEVGEERKIKVTFPKDYYEKLAGKKAVFEVKAKELLESVNPKIDDEFAKKVGFDTLDALREAAGKQFTVDYDRMVRARMKKDLFDAFDEKFKFPVPEGMVEMEFNDIWQKLEQAKAQGDESLDKPEAELRKEYQRVAERRVRLGMILADIGKKEKIEVQREDLTKAVSEVARQYPGQEKQVFEFYQSNPRELTSLYGPILEEKVVDFLLGKVKTKEKKITIEELMKPVDEDEHVHDENCNHDHDNKPKKKAAPKKAAASEDKPARAEAKEKKPAAKKVPAKKKA